MTNNYTQLAGQFIGTHDQTRGADKKKSDPPGQIHITDGQTDQILDVITAKNILSNNHHKSLKDNLETFDFETLSDNSFSEHLGKMNRVIIPDEDGKYIEFVIYEATRNMDRQIEVYASASYLMLKKAKVINPQTLESQTTATVTAFALNGTEWQPGIMTFAGIRSFNIESHTNPFSFLKRIANEFDLELRFRVETDGNKITGRYVDLVEKVGEWQGREVEFRKDLIGIKRSEKTDDIVTALVGIGPEKEDGTRLEVFVDDLDALARWGRNGQHIIETYEPESADQDMTEERLITLTTTELNKRINAVVEYETTIVDLEHVPGMENKKIRFGDTIKIKDTKFNPPLYLEARVHTQDRDIVDKSQKIVELGDYIEYTEEEVNAIWKSLQAQIREKITQYDLVDYTYAKPTIDNKDKSVFSDGTVYSDAVATTAEGNAKQYTDDELVPVYQGLIDIDSAVDALETNKITLADAELKIQDTIDNPQDYVGNFDGDVAADNLILRETLFAQNATITGTIHGDELVFNNGTFNDITAIGGTFKDVVITGQLNGVGGTFTGSLDGVDGTFTGNMTAGSIDIEEDIKVGNNIQIGETNDTVNPKTITFNSGSTITGYDTSIDVSAQSVSVLGADYASFGLMSGGGYPYDTLIFMDGFEMFLQANKTTVLGDLDVATNIEVAEKGYFGTSISVGHNVGAYNVDVNGTGRFTGNLHVDNLQFTSGVPLWFNTALSVARMQSNGRLRFEQTNGQEILAVRGEIGEGNDKSIRLEGLSSYTTSASANMHISGSYNVIRSTSARKYKKNIEPLEESYAENFFENAEPVWFQSKCNADPDNYGFYGYVADDVAEIDPRLVIFRDYDEDGNALYDASKGESPEVEGFHYDRVPALLHTHMKKKFREYDDEFNYLKIENQNLNVRINELEARIS